MAQEKDDSSCFRFCSLCQTVAMAEDRQSLLNTLATELVSMLDARASLIRLLNREQNELTPGAWHGVSEERVTAMPRSLDENTIDASALARQELIEVRNPSLDPRWKNLPLARQEGLVSVLAAPLCAAQRCIGTVHIYFEEKHQFTDYQRFFLRSVCTQAAATFWRQLLQRQAEAVAEVSREISSSLEESQVLGHITRYATEVLSLKGSSLRMLDEDGERLELRSTYGLSEDYMNKGPVELKKSPVDQTVLQGQAVTVNEDDFDAKLQYADQARREGIRSILCLPLFVRNRPVGGAASLRSAPVPVRKGSRCSFCRHWPTTEQWLSKMLAFSNICNTTTSI